MRTLIAIIIIFSCASVHASNAFMAITGDGFVAQEGDFDVRHPPCSTFKIPIALMGYNEGILIDENQPEWQFEEGFVDWLDVWKEPQTPSSWMRDSCVWYSQSITKELGEEKFEYYVSQFDYGNRDVSGNLGKDDGLTHSWLCSSLQISVTEQVQFLQKLLENALPVSGYAHEKTREIMFVEDFEGGKLFGKTGGGYTEDKQMRIGWFVGWVERDGKQIIFAQYIEEPYTDCMFTGRRAKEELKEKIAAIIKMAA